MPIHRGPLRTSASMPVHHTVNQAQQQPPRPQQQPNQSPTVLPKLRGARGGPPPGSKGVPKRLPANPLVEIERFLEDELECLDAGHGNTSAEVRLEPHRAALELFIARFDTYAPPLSAIKRAYEEQLRALQRQVGASVHEHQSAHAEFLANHDRQVASLQAQLEHAHAKLASAQQEISLLKDDTNLDGTSAAPRRPLAMMTTPTIRSGCARWSPLTSSSLRTAMGCSLPSARSGAPTASTA